MGAYLQTEEDLSDLIGGDFSALAIVEGSKYIPNVDTWNEDFTAAAQTNDKLVVTSVHDGYAWNDNIG